MKAGGFVSLVGSTVAYKTTEDPFFFFCFCEYGGVFVLLFSTTAGFYVCARFCPFPSYPFFFFSFSCSPLSPNLYTFFCCCDPIDSTRLLLMMGEEEDGGGGGGREEGRERRKGTHALKRQTVPTSRARGGGAGEGREGRTEGRETPRTTSLFPNRRFCP